MDVRTLIVAVFLILPSAAAAYATPEEVLFGNPSAVLTPPPNHRTTGDRLDEQQRLSAERRKLEQDLHFAAQRPPPPPPAEVEADAEGQDEDTEGDAEDIFREEEEEEEEERGMSIAPWEDPTRGAGDTLHSGAPLTPTGLGSWIAASVLLGAGLWTIRRARPGKTEKVC